MVENFFQERFSKNLKFYEGKTPEELKQKYELLYGDLDLKDIYLAELTIIKRLLNKEKQSKKDSSNINFEEYIKNIDELYSKIENMDESQIKKNKETIELIIASTKLSLNSIAYFDVNVEKLKQYNLNGELTSFIDDEATKKQETNELLKFKKILIEEIEKKQQAIENLKKGMRSPEPLEKLEELYWELRSDKIDSYSFLAAALQLDLTKDEKKKILLITQKIVEYNDQRSIDQFDRKMSFLVSDYKRENNIISARIIDIERSISMIIKLSQNIDENGHFIQSVNDELIDEYINQITSLQLNVIPLTHQMLKEQTRVAKKQRIEQIVRLIENKTKTIEKKTKIEEKKTEEKKQTPEIPKEYKEVLDKAKEILGILSNPNFDMNLDELETYFVEDLSDKTVDENKINETIKSASNETSRLKLIVHGLNYQISNINPSNINKSMNLIKLYLEHYNKCYTKLLDEQNKEKLFNNEISIMQNEIIKKENEIEEDILKQLDAEKIKNLDSYVKVDFENMTEDERNLIEEGLGQFGLDITTLKLYKSYTILKNQISETKIFIDMVKEEKSLEFLTQVEEKIELISDLVKQYTEAKRIYEEEQAERLEQIEEENISTDALDDDGNILIYFENEDGKTQVEERIIADFKKFGEYTQTDIAVLNDSLKVLKEETSNNIYTNTDPIKPEDRTYKKRRVKKGDFRVAYLPLNGNILNTNKPVYLVISAGKKKSEHSDVFDDANYLRNKVLAFVKKYESLANADEQTISSFLERQKQHEKNIMEIAQNGRGELHGTFKK